MPTKTDLYKPCCVVCGGLLAWHYYICVSCESEHSERGRRPVWLSKRIAIEAATRRRIEREGGMEPHEFAEQFDYDGRHASQEKLPSERGIGAAWAVIQDMDLLPEWDTYWDDDS